MAPLSSTFDRGELVDAAALDAALAAGKVAQAAIDADIFCDAGTGTASGPLAAFLPLIERHRDRILLLPHVAADTDHPTRVAGAKLAVDLVLGAIRERTVRNLVGDLPEGYLNAGVCRPAGVGGVSAPHLRDLRARAPELHVLIADARRLVDSTKSWPKRRMRSWRR